jgi:phenylalanyl-tRNA synthetase beta chain
MKVLLSWLREFAPFDLAPAELGRVMDSLGMAVEEMRLLSFDGIVVARVLGTRPHPSADRIHLVDVDTGDGEAVQVCCGAFNMMAGDIVPLATVGSVMPNGLQIARRQMRGEWSNGMLCSAAELGLGADGSGILILPADLPVGSGLAAGLGLSGDAVFDLEINPNRPDAMSMVGVARDLAARLDLPFAVPEPAPRWGDHAASESASVEIVDPDLCGRFAAGVLRGVRPGSSPLTTVLRLDLCGMRAIGAVVDASNYVMLELGVPNHAYDLAAVPAGHLRVRRARGPETVVTLDGIERVVDAGDGLICDRDDRPIGLAGVMGGAGTEIGDATSDVLLEAAWWDPASITRTSRRLALRSEASARFSRGTDPEMIPTAIARFAELLAPHGVSIDRGLVDERGGLSYSPTVRVRVPRVNAILGTSLTAAEVRSELDPIGFTSEPASDGEEGDVLVVTVPSWRPDSTTEIDVIEEVARHHGYERIARSVPRSPDPGSLTALQRDRHLVREVLVGLGLDEAMPFPFLAPGDNDRAGLSDDVPLTLLNPFDAKESVLRTSLRPGLLKAVAYNESHRNAGVRLFEIGHVFHQPLPDADLPDEHEMVAIALAAADAPAAKQALDTLMDALAVEGYRLRRSDDLPGVHPTRGATVLAGDTEIGVVGEVDPAVAEAFGLEGRVATFELDLVRLLEQPHGGTSYRPVSRYPTSDIDLAFIVPEDVAAGEVEATLAAAAGDELMSLTLFDVYRGDQAGPGRRSLAFALRLQAADHTLTDGEVGTIRQRCIEAVEAAHSAALRG